MISYPGEGGMTWALLPPIFQTMLILIAALTFDKIMLMLFFCKTQGIFRFLDNLTITVLGECHSI